MMRSDLPPDLVEEILSSVPATSLKRLRSTCKRWNTLFKDQRFAEKHFAKAQRNSHVIMLKEFMFYTVNVDLNVVPPSIEFKHEIRLKDFHSNKSEQVYIHDVFHCDGLLLCTTIGSRRLVVWNPCLGETRWIQYNNYNYGGWSMYALGYANTISGRSYKIMRCWLGNYNVSKPVVEIYEFRSETWRILDEITLSDMEQPHSCVSIKGNTYWANSFTTNNFLFHFDFTKESLKSMRLPGNNGWNVPSVVGEEKLALLHQSNRTSSTDMWVTDTIDTDTEAALTWSKSFTLDNSNSVPRPISFVLDGEKKVALCSSDFHEFMVYTIGEDDECCASIPFEEDTSPCILNYVPSLVQIHQ